MTRLGAHIVDSDGGMLLRLLEQLVSENESVAR